MSIPNPAPVPIYLLGLVGSIADNGRVLDDVPTLPLPGVEGDSPPIRDNRAPDRGVTFPDSFEVVGDRISSLRIVDGPPTSERTPRRGQLMGDTFFDPASLGVNGLWDVRTAGLSVGVKGLAGVPFFCLSRGIVEQEGSLRSAGWAE